MITQTHCTSSAVGWHLPFERQFGAVSVQCTEVDYLKAEYVETQAVWILDSCLTSKTFAIGIIVANSRFPAVSSHRCILFWVVLKICRLFPWVLNQDSLDRFLLWFGLLGSRSVCRSELDADLAWKKISGARKSPALLLVISQCVPSPESSRWTKCASLS